jgi:hypothetical protein
MLQNSGVITRESMELVAALPYQLYVDHPEGLELWAEAGDGGLLIIDDAPPPERADTDTLTVRADVICPRQVRRRSNLNTASGYLLATWSRKHQRADAGNPLIMLVSALGLEPRTL